MQHICSPAKVPKMMPELRAEGGVSGSDPPFAGELFEELATDGVDDMQCAGCAQDARKDGCRDRAEVAA